MSNELQGLADEARIALENMADRARGLVVPSVRLGVTGLSRAGKTVFITALVHHLLKGTRLPLFAPMRQGRYRGAELAPQADDGVPTFDYRTHVRRLTAERAWPDSTRSISELRLTLAYDRASLLGRMLGPGAFHLDIVDYPGEWLLDLPLLAKDYRTWSREALERARLPERTGLAGRFLGAIAAVDPSGPQDEEAAVRLADAFKSYLSAARSDEHAYSTVPPGRFLMPGDLDGSPALTFAPLDLAGDGGCPRDSLAAMMERRYEAYKSVVVRPFFRDHFARLDRQVVLVDVLHALNAGPAAVLDLENAMAEILACFRVGSGNILTQLFNRRIDRILFAATKADHLHHTSHDRLELILSRLLDGAISRAKFTGAKVDVRAVAAVRATREASVREGGETLPCIVGVPKKGERLGDQLFDGTGEVAFFPGDLPVRPDALFVRSPQDGAPPEGSLVPDLRFMRFRPPEQGVAANGTVMSLPHIRLDRALDFLIGDKFQ